MENFVSSCNIEGTLHKHPIGGGTWTNIGICKVHKRVSHKKRTVSYEFIGNLHHCSAIVSHSLVQNKDDPDAFIIPYIIRSYNFVNALRDPGAIINLNATGIIQIIGLENPRTNKYMVIDGGSYGQEASEYII